MNEDDEKVPIEGNENLDLDTLACLRVNEHFLLEKAKVYIFLSVKSDPLPKSLPIN